MPLESFTRATLRSAEFGFFGVVVYTRVQTPRRCGLPFSAGGLVWPTRALRPLRTSCWMVGTTSPSLTFACFGVRGPFIGSGADAGSDPPREDPRARACRRLLGSPHDRTEKSGGRARAQSVEIHRTPCPGTEIGSGVRARESPTERALPIRVLCARQRRQSSSGVVPATSGAAHRSDPWAPAGAGKGLPQPSPAWHSDSVHTSSGAAAATIGAAPVRPTAPARYAVGMFGTSLPINMFLA